MGLFQTIGNITGIGSSRDPAGKAMEYYKQIPDKLRPYYQPHIERGKEAGDRAYGEYEKQLTDPVGFMNALMEKYQPSQEYQYKSGQLGKALSNTAAAGGYAGTPEAQRQQGELIQGLLSSDMQNWLGNVLGRYERGLGGYEGLSERGYGAGREFGGIEGQTLSNLGNLAYNREQQKMEKDRALRDLAARVAGAVGSGGMSEAARGMGSFMSGKGGSPGGQNFWKIGANIFGG